MKARRRLPLPPFLQATALALVLLLAGGTSRGRPAGAAAPPDGSDEARAAESLGATLLRLVEADWVERDRRFAPAGTAGSAPAAGESTAVTTAQDAAGGCDGVKNGRWGFHTASQEQDPWWQVDLEREWELDRVVVYNRTDSGTAPRARFLRLEVAREADLGSFELAYQHDGTVFHGASGGEPLVIRLAGRGVRARIVRLSVPGRCSFALDEVEVYPREDPDRNVALGRPADQKSTGPHSWPGTLGHAPARVPPGGDFSPAHTRRVIERARRLAARRELSAGFESSAGLDPLRAQLDEIEVRLAGLERSGEAPPAARRAIYLEARWAARAIAFANPRLDFDAIVFVKRHDPGGVFHMCDQYYGFNARAGGGLFVLHDPFGPEPRLENLLRDAVVEDGRLRGRRLIPGSFLSPELSCDGKTILFAYSEAKGKDLEWTPESCYHIFRVRADGTGLVQLTDGPWNDFDPCFLPNGRIAFISERRGGYLRCGRHCPTYTLHSMAPDGTDIIRLSFHETHEWHPSVTNDGMIAYTRWDYVDRDTNVAHHIWTCYPDGRDPRSFHGNYPERRESRPWMEMSIRAIPGSRKFVATAAAHHGHAFGSLVLIDPALEDDGATAQLERLTPEVPFPEGEGGRGFIREHMVYGTAWPLSEDDYLCVCDPAARNRGIYWIDRWGNKELLYRDPEISSLSPIPLRPRPVPPVIPDETVQTAAARARAGRGVERATVAVLSVYDSDFAWPPGTRITALRIVQILPKTTPPPNQPRIGVAEQTNARAVLGTVPVEADGSAYFEAPPGKLLYFQALDERGMAVQSMRSGTYVHPGERLVCRGCHEPKRRAPPPAGPPPLALGRPPSEIVPDAEGSHPFSYVRLVQPVLDRNCAGCHAREGALDLSGLPAGEHGWTRSYANLAGKYGFYFHVYNGSIQTGAHGGSRTVPGVFGARAAPLLGTLDERHHGVRLSAADFHRLVLWLDLNSEFYGAYEDTEAQACGKVVRPSLE